MNTDDTSTDSPVSNGVSESRARTRFSGMLHAFFRGMYRVRLPDMSVWQIDGDARNIDGDYCSHLFINGKT